MIRKRFSAIVLPFAVVVTTGCLVPRPIADFALAERPDFSPLPHLSLLSVGTLVEWNGKEVLARDSFHVYLGYSGGRVLHSVRQTSAGERIEGWLEVNANTQPLRGWQRFEDAATTCIVTFEYIESAILALQFESTQARSPVRLRFRLPERTFLKLASSVTEAWLIDAAASIHTSSSVVELPTCPQVLADGRIGVIPLQVEALKDFELSEEIELALTNGYLVQYGHRRLVYWLSPTRDYLLRRKDSNADIQFEILFYWSF